MEAGIRAGPIRLETPSRNTSWDIPCRPSACLCTQLRASSPCRSPHGSMSAWSGPIATNALCIDGGGRQRCLRRAQRYSLLSRLWSIMASGGTVCPLRGRHSRDKGFLPADVHRSLLERHQDHSSLWLTLQNRTQLQTGHTSIGAFAYHF
jgi:hypothetical protein